MSTDKAKFVSKLKSSGGTLWKKAREAKAERRLTAPDGDYIGKLRAVTWDLDKNEKPFFMFRIFLVSDDEDINGQPAFKSHFLTPPKKGAKQTLQQKYENLKKDFERLGIDLSESDLPDMVDAADQLSEDRPFVRVRIRHDKGDPTANPPRKPGTYEPSIYINGIADDADVPDAELPEDEEPEDEDAETEDEEVDDAEVDNGKEAEDDDEDSGEDGEEEADGEDGEEEDDAPPEDFEEEAPKRTAKKVANPASAGKASAKKTKAPKFSKGDEVLYVSRAGGKPTPHKVLSVTAAGYLNLKNVKTGAQFKDIDPKAVTASE